LVTVTVSAASTRWRAWWGLDGLKRGREARRAGGRTWWWGGEHTKEEEGSSGHVRARARRNKHVGVGLDAGRSGRPWNFRWAGRDALRSCRGDV
jgi:hypothetical protein